MGSGWLPRMIAVAAIAGILFCHGFCFAELPPNYSFLRQATRAPKVSYYDYIVVGGGTAGIPLAATLSEKFNVLVLEHGGSPYGNPNVTNMADVGSALSDSSATSPVERIISEDGVAISRPRVLGGGSSINFGFWSRAESEIVRESGWDPKLVEESYEWVENTIVREPRIGQWVSAVKDGLLEAGVVPDNGFTYEHLEGTKIGGTIFDRDGRRHGAADLLQLADPSRITVFLHASVERILFKVQGKSKPLARGVVFTDASGTRHRAFLKRGSHSEIILSAGAFGSPQLLMLSGLGPKQQLQSLNISILLDQPSVGQNVSDNPMNAVFVPSPVPVEASLVQIVGITRFGSYIESFSGVSIVGGVNMNFGNYSPRMGGFVLEKVLGPQSRGQLTLKSRNVNDHPSVIYNYFQDPRDLQRCVDGIETIERVIESEALSAFRYGNLTVRDLLNLTSSLPLNLRPKNADDATSTEQFCKDNVMSIGHYHGGCQLGEVVDKEYKVIGVDSLRVVDGSTFKNSPGTNPQATVMMLGRYVGVKISTERLAS